MLKKISMLLMGAVLLTGIALSASAQPEETAMFSYGNVVSVAVDNIVLEEYNYEQDTMAQVTYAINAETKFEDLGSVQEIKAGDEVEIEYAEAEGKRVAKVVSKAEELEEGEAPDLGIPEDIEAGPVGEVAPESPAEE